MDDKLILAKLHFFKCIAGELQPFLANYQTDMPMVCFLATDLSTLLRALMTPGELPYEKDGDVGNFEFNP